jgi:CubicO group peptidase (beta-lactamase class C family)
MLKNLLSLLSLLLAIFLLPLAGAMAVDSPAAKPAAANAPTADAPAPEAGSPGEKVFRAWLEAVNSGKLETVRQFVAEQFDPPPTGELPVDRIAGRQFSQAQKAGGLSLLKISDAGDGKIVGVLEEKGTGLGQTVTMFVKTTPPHKIRGMGFSGGEMPVELLPRGPLSDDQLRAKIDALITKLEKIDQFSGVILVARNGTPVYQRASGLASRAWNAPNRVDTKFNVASIGKMFTAVAVAQLVERGKLSYEDKLEKVLPRYGNKEIAQTVTVAHLLSHTAGIKEKNLADDSFRKGFRTLKEYLADTTGDTAKFAPGTRLSYSNHGYLLLGAIIEQASGQDYYAYMREHVFAPAGMTNTDNFDLDTEPANLAVGYMDAAKGQRVSNQFKLPVRGLPSGLGYSTAEDLAKFHHALLSHKLINAESLKTVWTGRMDYHENSKYAYGFAVKEYNGARIVGHGGGWLGITNKMDMYPDLGLTVVILNNIDSDPNALAFKLREWLTQR